MNIILMTILLTLLAAGLVVLLVWLSVVAWKSMRFKRNSESKFEDLDKRMDCDYNSHSDKADEIYRYIDETKKDANQRIDDTQNRISHEFEELHRETIKSIWDKFDDNQQLVQNRIDALERSIDSRFDKLHNLVTSPQKS